MDEDGIGLVLARASELRSKITNCIQKSPILQTDNNSTEQQEEENEHNKTHLSPSQFEAEAEAEAEADSLLNIRDALQSLEAQLSSLQALQQQQWYEREAALSEIDYSRKKLLKKLKQYKGEDLTVIQEAVAFASETVDDNNDLLLPPYPSRPSRSLVSGDGHLSHFPATLKYAQNGVTNGGDPTKELQKNLRETERNQVGYESKSLFKGVRAFINAAAKTVLTLVGVISILSLAGFEPRLKKRDTQFKVLGLFQQLGTEEKKRMVQCPPGKVLVLEDGETRCLVKERVEIPFESIVATPDVNYGFG